jgi:putative lipoprotein
MRPAARSRVAPVHVFALACVVGLPAARTARAEDSDPWFGRDKALHFGASATIAVFGYGATAQVTPDRRLRLAVGGGVALSFGIAKELWDLSGNGDASWRDLTWDAVGTVTGLAVAAALDWTLQRLAARHPAAAP